MCPPMTLQQVLYVDHCIQRHVMEKTPLCNKAPRTPIGARLWLSTKLSHNMAVCTRLTVIRQGLLSRVAHNVLKHSFLANPDRALSGAITRTSTKKAQVESYFQQTPQLLLSSQLYVYQYRTGEWGHKIVTVMVALSSSVMQSSLQFRPSSLIDSPLPPRNLTCAIVLYSPLMHSAAMKQNTPCHTAY